MPGAVRCGMMPRPDPTPGSVREGCLGRFDGLGEVALRRARGYPAVHRARPRPSADQAGTAREHRRTREGSHGWRPRRPTRQGVVLTGRRGCPSRCRVRREYSGPSRLRAPRTLRSTILGSLEDVPAHGGSVRMWLCDLVARPLKAGRPCQVADPDGDERHAEHGKAGGCGEIPPHESVADERDTEADDSYSEKDFRPHRSAGIAFMAHHHVSHSMCNLSPRHFPFRRLSSLWGTGRERCSEKQKRMFRFWECCPFLSSEKGT